MLKKTHLLIVVLAIVKFVLPFILQSSVFELHRDEYLYYQQGQHLALGYLENPPLLGWLSGISSLLGGSFFWIKFWPCIFGSFTVLLTAAIARQLGGGLFAQALAALAIIFSGYMRMHFLFQPNFLDVFFWSLAAYFLIAFINNGKDRFLYYLSITLAVGWWGKYSILFFMTSTVLAILLTRYRSMFLRKHFWYAAAVGLLIVIPNLVWQYYHNWPLVHHMKELRDTQLQYLQPLDFLKEQVLQLFPFLIVWLAGLIWLLRSDTYRVIALVYCSVIALLLVSSGKGYYALGAYPMLLAAGGVCIERWGERFHFARYATITVVMVLSLVSIKLLLPTEAPEKMAAFNERYHLADKGLLRWEDLQNHPLQQDFADMLGWKELTQKTDRFLSSLPESVQKRLVVLCGNYGQAGALQYYGSKALRQKIISTNGSFILWAPKNLSFDHLIFIADAAPAVDDPLFSHFESATKIDSVTDPYSRQYGNQIIFFKNADAEFHRLARQALQQKRATFSND
jgi:hypothetical protein